MKKTALTLIVITLALVGVLLYLGPNKTRETDMAIVEQSTAMSESDVSAALESESSDDNASQPTTDRVPTHELFRSVYDLPAAERLEAERLAAERIPADSLAIDRYRAVVVDATGLTRETQLINLEFFPDAACKARRSSVEDAGATFTWIGSCESDDQLIILTISDPGADGHSYISGQVALTYDEKFTFRSTRPPYAVVSQTHPRIPLHELETAGEELRQRAANDRS